LNPGGEGHSASSVEVSRSRRALTAEELRERLRPSDSVGTEYKLRSVAPEVVDGRGVIEFAPAPPMGLTWLRIEDAPGTALIMAVQSCKNESRG